MRHLLCLAVLGALATTGTAVGDTWWWDFEFDDPNDLPPAQGDGWLRRYQPAPFGLVQDGILTYDSNDPQSYDFWEYSRPGALDPGPNQVFLMEWKLWTEWVSYWGDPGLSVKSDDAWVVSLEFDVDVIHSFHEYVDIPIPPGQWHAYALVSADMRFYELFVDRVLTWQGSFAHRFIQSLVQWGDVTQGEASRHHWDYMRFGAVQAPLTGDTDCNGTVDFGDINPFIETLTQGSTGPGCWYSNADINGDGSVDFADINPFVALLSS